MDAPVCLVAGVGPEKGTGAEIARRFAVGGYSAMSERSRGWLRYLYRKATTPDTGVGSRGRTASCGGFDRGARL